MTVFCFCGFLYADQQEDAMMKAWMAYATPGEAQKSMGAMAGSWDTTITSYMAPGTPTVEKGTATFESIMDGRYIIEKAEGNFQGMPFHGMGTYGYDNGMKTYVFTWIDNMGTGIMNGTGSSDDGGKTITYTAKSFDPLAGKEMNFKSVLHMMSADQYHYEMFGSGPDGKEMKMMEIMYDRKK
jgi:uncharacterized protein DUF1579